MIPLSDLLRASAVDRRSTSRLAGERGRYAMLFALGPFLSGISILQGINPTDEGLMLQAAARVAHGQLPYRDFYCNYGPGQPFLLRGLQLVLGPSLLTWPVVRVALDATVGVLAYALTRREAPEALALSGWLAAAAMAFPSIPSPNPAAIVLGLGATLLVRHPGEQQRQSRSHHQVNIGALQSVKSAIGEDLDLPPPDPARQIQPIPVQKHRPHRYHRQAQSGNEPSQRAALYPHPAPTGATTPGPSRA